MQLPADMPNEALDTVSEGLLPWNTSSEPTLWPKPFNRAAARLEPLDIGCLNESSSLMANPALKE